MKASGLESRTCWRAIALAPLLLCFSWATAAAQLPGSVFRDCSGCPELVVIPSGQFVMGSPDSEADRESDEQPLRTVTIAQPFALGRYEVTFDEWDLCVREGPCAGIEVRDEGWGRSRRPVINVAWQDASRFVQWLRDKTGRPYRLPSEAEWEYAARAGSQAAYYTGSDPPFGRENFDQRFHPKSPQQASDVLVRTKEVGSFPPNAFGLYDMLGNVREWVADCHQRSYKGAPSDGRAWMQGDCGTHTIRGGAWGLTAPLLRSAARWQQVPDFKLYTFGFRVARDLP